MNELIAGEVLRRLVRVLVAADDTEALDEKTALALMYSSTDAAVGSSIRRSDLIAGLGATIDRGSWGLHLDHSEAPLLQERCRHLVDHHVGRPDTSFSDSGATEFSWDEHDVTAGFASFDEWLWRSGGRRFRLLAIETDADSSMAVFAPEAYQAKVHNGLSACGLNPRLASGQP